MTGNTATRCKSTVINGCRYPLLRAVANITFIRGWNVRRAFACRNDIIVTGRTHTQYLRVVYTTC